MAREDIGRIFAHGMKGADLGLVEGVRVLYEGAESLGDTGSSAAFAKLLGLPVVLVVSARSITRSAAAIVKGFQSFDPEIRIQGVILNNVSGAQHIRKATEASSSSGSPVDVRRKSEPLVRRQMLLAFRKVTIKAQRRSLAVCQA